MSIFSDCRVTVLLADYAAADASGKLNLLGAGFNVTGLQATGLTPPQYVVTLVEVPARFIGQDFPVGIELKDDTTGQTVMVPGPTGNLEALRIQQLAKAEPPLVPGVYLPPTLWSRAQLVMGFPNGLPLQPGGLYHWRVEIEGRHRAGWSAHFHVAGPPPPPVFGGPSGTEAIEGLPPEDQQPEST